MRSREKHYAKLCWFCKEYNGNQSLTSCHSIVLPVRALPCYCGASWLPSHSLAVVGAWLCRIYPRWLHVWTCVHTWYLVTCSDISTVLHGTQGPWAVTPLSGWSSPGPSPLHSKEAIVLPFGFPPWRRDIIPSPQGTSALKQELICFHLPLSWFT